MSSVSLLDEDVGIELMDKVNTTNNQMFPSIT